MVHEIFLLPLVLPFYTLVQLEGSNSNQVLTSQRVTAVIHGFSVLMHWAQFMLALEGAGIFSVYHIVLDSHAQDPDA